VGRKKRDQVYKPDERNRLDLLPADIADRVRVLCADSTAAANFPASYACVNTNHACLRCQERARALLNQGTRP